MNDTMKQEVEIRTRCPDERAQGVMERLMGGGILLPSGWRVDPTRYSGTSVISRADLGEPMDMEQGLGPLPYPLRLSDFLPLVGEMRAQAPKIFLEGDGMSRFVLRSQGDPRQGQWTERAAGLTRVNNADFRVIGILRRSMEDAASLLAEPAGVSSREWLEPEKIFDLATRDATHWLARLPGATNMTSQEYLRAKEPLSRSERFERAERSIFKALLRTENNAVLLKGVAGSGKSSLILMMAADFTRMRVPSRLQGHVVASINIELFLPSRQTAEEAEKAMIRSEMAKRRIFWVIDEASRLLDRGSTESLDSLLLFMDQGGKVILASDQAFLLEKREAFVRRLHRVYLPPADRNEVEKIAVCLSKHLSEVTGVKMEPDAVQSAVELSHAMPFAQPHAVVSLVRDTIFECELRGEEEASRSAVEREIKAIVHQGDTAAPVPETLQGFIDAVRKEGFRGHEGFLKEFGNHLLRALRRRFSSDRSTGALWACAITGRHGNGKTMLSRIVGRMITGSDPKVLTIHCKDFEERHSVQSLRGSPMSYVGYGEGGILQNFVKQNPDGVLIVLKPELGHQAVMALVCEICEGSFRAGDGQEISTRGLVVLIVSNAGSDSGKAIGFETCHTHAGGEAAEALEKLLASPAMGSAPGSIPMFYMPPLHPSALRNIVRLEVEKFGRARGVKTHVDQEVLEKIVSLSRPDLSGARGVLAQYRDKVEPLMDEALERVEAKEREEGLEMLHLSLDSLGNISCQVVTEHPGVPEDLVEERNDGEE
jgi:hypothetical protein